MQPELIRQHIEDLPVNLSKKHSWIAKISASLTGLLALVCLSVGPAVAGGPPVPAGGNKPTGGNPAGNINLIQHVIYIVKENRSFDHMFGLFPGANGVNMA